jgi:menaquinone-dependent protoporphyrinogen oxidase
MRRGRVPNELVRGAHGIGMQMALREQSTMTLDAGRDGPPAHASEEWHEGGTERAQPGTPQDRPSAHGLVPGPDRVLVAFASQGGSTAEIAQTVGIVLLEAGCDIDVRPARQVERLTGFTAVVVGSGLYHGAWLPEAFKFLQRHRVALSDVPVWLFDSGPLDCSAEGRLLPLPTGVANLARSIGARGHNTFGGKLGITGLSLEERMLVLEGHGGDYRNFDDVRSWAGRIAHELARDRAARA